MLTISPTPEAEQWLHSQAQRLGIAAEELAGRMFNEMVAAKAATDEAATDEAEAARLAAIDKAMGFAADINISSEDLRRERREDLARDEAQFQRHFGQTESK